MIKSYKGKLADDGQDTINLHTNNGKTGYKISKFQIMGPDANTNIEAVVKIYKVKQTAASTAIDFTDTTLIGVGIYNDVTDPHYLAGSVIVFDNETVNQDIYITSKCHDNTGDMNYYLELEQISLTEDQALVAIVKNLRNEQ